MCHFIDSLCVGMVSVQLVTAFDPYLYFNYTKVYVKALSIAFSSTIFCISVYYIHKWTYPGENTNQATIAVYDKIPKPGRARTNTRSIRKVVCSYSEFEQIERAWANRVSSNNSTEFKQKSNVTSEFKIAHWLVLTNILVCGRKSRKKIAGEVIFWANFDSKCCSFIGFEKIFLGSRISFVFGPSFRIKGTSSCLQATSMSKFEQKINGLSTLCKIRSINITKILQHYSVHLIVIVSDHKIETIIHFYEIVSLLMGHDAINETFCFVIWIARIWDE